MSSQFDLYNYARSACYGSIKELHDVDGLSWDQLSEWAGFDGPASLRNVVNEESHNLDFARGCMLLKKSSKHKNLRIHKHCVDTIQWEIVPRAKDVEASGELAREVVETTKAMALADDALEAGNTEVLIKQYRRMQKVLAKMRAEIETVQSRMRRL